MFLISIAKIGFLSIQSTFWDVKFGLRNQYTRKKEVLSGTSFLFCEIYVANGYFFITLSTIVLPLSNVILRMLTPVWGAESFCPPSE